MTPADNPFEAATLPHEPRVAHNPWLICIVLLFATLLNYMDRQALAVTLPTLKAEFNLQEDRIGRVEGCFGYAFAFGSLLFGWLADRWGPKFLYPAVLAGWSMAGVATAFAGHPVLNDLLQSASDRPGTGVYRWLLICRIVLGVCEAGHWPCALLTVRAILLAKHRTLGNGILQSGASIGAIIVPLYVEAAERAGQSWQFPFWSIGLAGLCWIPIWFLLVRGHDLRVVKTDATASGQGVPADGAAGQQAVQPRVMLVRRLLAAGIVVATLTISWQFLRAWLLLYLQDSQGYSQIAARGLMSGYFIASDVGCILSGLLVAQLARRGMTVTQSRAVGYGIFTLLTACGALVPVAGGGWLMILLLFLTGAGILGLHPFYYSMTQELSSKHMGSLSGMLAAFGWIVSSTFQIRVGDHIKAEQSYDLGLTIVGLGPVLGLIAILLLWPRERAGG